jgi:hypothetical protein
VCYLKKPEPNLQHQTKKITGVKEDESVSNDKTERQTCLRGCLSVHRALSLNRTSAIR